MLGAPVRLEIWYHDPTEVDRASSWTGLTAVLGHVPMDHYDNCTDAEITRLFQYARPDAVVAVDGKPVVVLEQTSMNPSGHNLPQRFSCLLKAAENKVPSVYYYAERARRTQSDPGLRNVNVRVPLTQFRLLEIWDALSVSAFWPTVNGLPARGLQHHQALATVIDELTNFYLVNTRLPGKSDLAQLPESTRLYREMDRAIAEYGTARSYPMLQSLRRNYPNGLPYTQREAAAPIDPPASVRIVETDAYLANLKRRFKKSGRHWSAQRNNFLTRPESFVFPGKPIRSTMAEAEHPYPGHMSMLDVLYCRFPGGARRMDRRFNLIFELIEVEQRTFLSTMHSGSTGAHIIVNNADLIVLMDGALTGDSTARPQQLLLRV